MSTYTLEYWIDDDWYVGRLKEIPNVLSQGETFDELEENIRDAYRMIVESEPSPQPQGIELLEAELVV